MIRLFVLFGKVHLSTLGLFHLIMTNFDLSEHECPSCRTRHSSWKKHATYERHLVGFDEGRTTSYVVEIVRYRCASCKITHALLPDIIIPYNSYSILFILTVLRDYYTRTFTLQQICDKYQISHSTLYAWKEVFQKHKKLWLGLLESLQVSETEFLSSASLFDLGAFFRLTRVSFLQTKAAYSGPV